MSLPILKSTTSLCLALLLLQSGPGLAEDMTAPPQRDGVPCLLGQKDCKPGLLLPPAVPGNGTKAPDATPGAAPPVPAPHPPKQTPRAPDAPAAKAPDAQPKPGAGPAQGPPATSPVPKPAPDVTPAPTANDRPAAPKPEAAPIPAPGVPQAPSVAPAQPAPAAPTAKQGPAAKAPGNQPAPKADQPDAKATPQATQVPPPEVPVSPVPVPLVPVPPVPAPQIPVPPAPVVPPAPPVQPTAVAPVAPAAAPAAKAGTAKPPTADRTGTALPGLDALGAATGATTRPPVAAAAAPTDAASAPAARVVRLGVQDVRRSDQSAADRTAPQVNQPASGLTDFEKFGLIALGAVAVGAILSNGQTVVSNSGDRVVLRDQNGRYAVMHDDDALVRRPGSTVSTQYFNDGSVLSRVVQADGTVIVTVLDASGRVLRRSVEYPGRRPVLLYDDTRPERAYHPAYQPQRAQVFIPYTRTTSREMLLREFETPQAYGRTFSLRQVRDVREIRDLVPQADLSTLTFDTGSSALTADQAQTLAALGGAMADLIARNPAEVFLIEGHTDAVGDAASNLALSDARAESVALALTEMFGVPAQNMVTQGYGEADLALQSQGAAQVNRRVVVRRITPLLATAEAN